MFASGNAGATMTAAGPVTNGWIDVDNPAAAAMSADDAASSMLEKWKRDKNRTKDIDIQACDVILQLSVGCLLIA
jgi:hypothetical protein